MEVGLSSAWQARPPCSGELHPRTILSLEQYMAALIEAEEGRDDFFFMSDPAPKTIVEELRPTRPACPASCQGFGSVPVSALLGRDDLA